MDSNNTDTIEREDSLDALLIAARGGEETCFDMARSVEKWNERDADSESFRRYEAGRKQSVKGNEKFLTPFLLALHSLVI